MDRNPTEIASFVKATRPEVLAKMSPRQIWASAIEYNAQRAWQTQQDQQAQWVQRQPVVSHTLVIDHSLHNNYYFGAGPVSAGHNGAGPASAGHNGAGPAGFERTTVPTGYADAVALPTASATASVPRAQPPPTIEELAVRRREIDEQFKAVVQNELDSLERRIDDINYEIEVIGLLQSENSADENSADENFAEDCVARVRRLVGERENLRSQRLQLLVQTVTREDLQARKLAREAVQVSRDVSALNLNGEPDTSQSVPVRHSRDPRQTTGVYPRSST
jgi:hypothetical protein